MSGAEQRIIRMTLPKDFEQYTRQLMGDDLYGTLEKALGEASPVSIRINPFKIDADLARRALMRQGAEQVAWCADGYYIGGRPAFTFDPLLHAGLYYVQEASSMFVCEVIRQLVHAPVLMLDLCAAPGGKSTALRSVLPSGSLLFTNEPVKSRASVLKENMEKFGHPDVIVTNNYARDYAKSGLKFDAILADVPCSGEGMFRKDANAITEWSLANVEKCRLLQRSIIEDVWPCLRPGGLLIYSTCTFNAHEDEENVAWIAENLGADFMKLDIPAEWGVSGSLTDDNPVYRFIPGRTRGEGLFMAVLRKHGDSDRAIGAVSVGQPLRRVTEDGFVRDIPEWWCKLYTKVRGKLHVIHAGVGVGRVKGRDIVPDASFALSITLDRTKFSQAMLSYADAIRFLRKEAVPLPDMPKGHVLVEYKGFPLGFEKNIGSRANNLYPQEWKIKSSHVPDSAPIILNLPTALVI